MTSLSNDLVALVSEFTQVDVISNKQKASAVRGILETRLNKKLQQPPKEEHGPVLYSILMKDDTTLLSLLIKVINDVVRKNIAYEPFIEYIQSIYSKSIGIFSLITLNALYAGNYSWYNIALKLFVDATESNSRTRNFDIEVDAEMYPDLDEEQLEQKYMEYENNIVNIGLDPGLHSDIVPIPTSIIKFYEYDFLLYNLYLLGDTTFTYIFSNENGIKLNDDLCKNYFNPSEYDYNDEGEKYNDEDRKYLERYTIFVKLAYFKLSKEYTADILVTMGMYDITLQDEQDLEPLINNIYKNNPYAWDLLWRKDTDELKEDSYITDSIKKLNASRNLINKIFEPLKNAINERLDERNRNVNFVSIFSYIKDESDLEFVKYLLKCNTDYISNAYYFLAESMFSLDDKCSKKLIYDVYNILMEPFIDIEGSCIKYNMKEDDIIKCLGEIYSCLHYNITTKDGSFHENTIIEILKSSGVYEVVENFDEYASEYDF